MWDHSGFVSNRALASARRLTLLSVQLEESAGSPRWLHVFDAASVPANGVAPTFAPIPLTVGGGATLDLSPAASVGGAQLAQGLAWAVSTTQATLTQSTDTAWVDALYQTQ